LRVFIRRGLAIPRFTLTQGTRTLLLHLEHDMRIPVLDDGFVEYLDHMGDDHAIVQAARTSFIGCKEDSKANSQLIRYLVRLKHHTPLEMCILKIGIRIPMDAWRQFVRHRLFSINEYSTRYSPAIDSAMETSEWRLQSTDNKQGSCGIADDETSNFLHSGEKFIHWVTKVFYKHCISKGIAREQARKNLPLCTYTEAVVECDLRGWLHFLELRLDPHAQLEIRQYAKAIADIIMKFWPITWNAFNDYVLNSVTLTACDLQAIHDQDYIFPTERERKEFNEKMEKIYGPK